MKLLLTIRMSFIPDVLLLLLIFTCSMYIYKKSVFGRQNNATGGCGCLSGEIKFYGICYFSLNLLILNQVKDKNTASVMSYQQNLMCTSPNDVWR